MMFTDREWLRFVSFALFAGIVVGTLYSGAIIAAGRPPIRAMTGTVLGGGTLALTLHFGVRRLLDRASEPASDGSAEVEA